jgi:hypothetical protein
MLAVDATTIRRDPELAAHRDEILDWLRDNGLDPHVVYSARTIFGEIRVREYLLNEHGERYIRRGKPAMRTRWVPHIYRAPIERPSWWRRIVTRRPFAPLAVAAVLAGNLLAWLTGWTWPA